MLKKLLVAMYTLLIIPVMAQSPGNIEFINNLGEKGAATFGDAVTFFLLIENKKPGGFEANLAELNKQRITVGIEEAEDTPLTQGMLAVMIARGLKLKDSLFYLMTGSRRYAFRACVAANIMDIDSSEWDNMSGEQLIEIMAKVSETMEAPGEK